MEKEKDQESKSKVKSVDRPSKKKKSWLKWLIVAVMIIIGVVGFNFYRFSKDSRLRFEAIQEQRQVMIDHWKEQGLTDEEIQLELENFRQERTDGDHRPPGMGVFRLFHVGRRSSGMRFHE
ncbi:hypothetical protein ACFL0Y_01910 [Patescibacteria group bacterium]